MGRWNGNAAWTLLRNLAFGVLPLCALATPLFTTEACSTQACDGSTRTFLGGELLDPDTWESNPIDGSWIEYGAQNIIIIHIPQFANRTIISTEVFISPAVNPNNLPVGNDPPDNSTLASGNLAEFEQVRTFSDATGPYLNVTVRNDTCAVYFARVVVTATDATPADAGAASEGADAALDASSDAAIDAMIDAAEADGDAP